MVESDAWFRLRWFLTGSLAAVITAFALEPPQPAPTEAVPAPKVFATPVIATSTAAGGPSAPEPGQ